MKLGILSRILLLGVAVSVCGCATYSERMASYRQDLTRNRAEAICSGLAAKVAEAPKRDALPWRLEYATALRSAGRFEMSDAVLDEAERIYDTYADAARVSISEEAVALVTNATHTDYRGAFHDGIMINVYQALNGMERGRFDLTRTALVRARSHQAAAVERYGKEIEANRKAIDEDANAATVRSSLDNPTLTARAVEGLPDTRGYENFVNPFADYLNGLFRYHRSSGQSDTEQARVSLARVASMAPDCEAVRFDLDRAARHESPDRQPTVYLIQEDGFAPYREEIRFDLPLPFKYVSYVGIAYPKLVSVPGEVRASLGAGSARVQAVRVCDMEAVVKQSFCGELPVILTRAVSSAVAKGVAAYVALRAAERQDPLIFWLTWLGTLGYQTATNSADTRSWNLLPKSFSVARLPMPEERLVTLTLDGQSQAVKLGAEGSAWCIYVRTFGNGGRAIVRAFRLR